MSDAYYTQFAGFVCDPNQPSQCRFELAFCPDGSYQTWIGGELTSGDYTIANLAGEGETAVDGTNQVYMVGCAQ